MAGIHRSSTLSCRAASVRTRLGMAGIHRSSTLMEMDCDGEGLLGMAGIHRSSTLGWKASCWYGSARDGRDSPLKYTIFIDEVFPIGARDGRDSPLKYTRGEPGLLGKRARD